MLHSDIINLKRMLKNAVFFYYKECKRLQRMPRAFIMNVKERKDRFVVIKKGKERKDRNVLL